MSTPTDPDTSRPVLSLDEYRARVAALPVPTAVQIASFVAYVCGAHSWYKHLPFWPPGAPLHFFLDPAAGMEMIVGPDGQFEARVRKEHGFHYSWLPTADYRERFGHLAFSRSSGTSVQLVAPDGTRRVGSDDSPDVFDLTTRRMVGLPEEISAAGRVYVTRVIHELGISGQSLGSVQPPQEYRWPEESGGQAVLEHIRKYVSPPVTKWVTRIMNGKPMRFGIIPRPEIPPGTPPMEDLLAPERKRQKEEMVRVVLRVIELAEIPNHR